MKSLFVFLVMISISVSAFGQDLIKDTAPQSATSAVDQALRDAQLKVEADKAARDAADAKKTTPLKVIIYGGEKGGAISK